MKAVKGNKEYTIAETQKEQYVRDGFDIVDDTGKVLQTGAGKSVPFAQHQAVLEENASLKEQIKALQAALDEEAGKEAAPPKK
ncbi:hypothetical protein [Clostridium merdae]|uniref:hypothetical protein n=1 Tax=Clostridium merdae TaxID=1958780 RepID=UPI000A268BC6|nr:hypothetical protein [Clostridium merdae]